MPVILERLRTLCAVDSGHDAPWGRERVVEYLEAWAEEAGCQVECVSTEPGTALIARLRVGERFPEPGLDGRRESPGADRASRKTEPASIPTDRASTATDRASTASDGASTPTDRPLIALLGHHDTVFPAGSALRCGFAVRDGRVFGPGAADMKGGLVVALHALAHLAGRQDLPPFAVELHSLPDEESRAEGPFATLARLAGARAALVLECARENGDLVVARKSQARLHMWAEGRSAHSGTEPERGRSALLALAREALRLDALTASRPGLNVTVGTISAGTSFNTVAGRGEAGIDIRARLAADLDWAIQQVCTCGDHDGVEIDVRTVARRPPLEETEAACRLFALARAVGRRVGLDLGACRTGGASDGCWTSAAGIPTLDGLGPVGGLDHSPNEYIEADSLPERVGLLAGLIVAIALEPPPAAGAVSSETAEPAAEAAARTAHPVAR